MTDTMEFRAGSEGPVLMSGSPAAVLARRIPTEELAAALLERAESDGVSLVGPGGLLAELPGSPRAASQKSMTYPPAVEVRGEEIMARSHRRSPAK